MILVCNFVVYMMQPYGWNFRAVEDPSDSILATIATPIAYLIAPIVGVALWQLAAAAVTGFIAKECVVSTLATVFMFEHLINEDLEAVGAIGASNMGGISVVAGRVNLKTGELTVFYAEDVPDALIKANLEKAGYTVAN